MDSNTMTRRELRQAAKGAPRKPWSRKKRLGILGGIPLAMVSTVAASAAIFAALAGISGNGTNGDFTAKWAAGQTPTLDTTSLTVQPQGAASVSNGTLVLPDFTVYPSEAFTVQGAVVAGSANSSGYITGITMPGLPSGYTATLLDGCGAQVTTSLTYVTVKVQAPAVQTPGATWSLSPDAGVRVSPLATATTPAPVGTTCEVYTAE